MVAVALAGLAFSASALVGQQALPEPEPLRILGRISTRLERASPRPDGSFVFTLFVGELRQALEPGDELRVFGPATGELLTAAHVTRPARIVGKSGRVHVCAKLVRADMASRIVELAAAAHSGFPESRDARDRFVSAHGAEVVLAVPFEPEKGDDPRDFVRFVNEARGGTQPIERALDPMVTFELQFNQPIDLATMGGIRMLTADRKSEVAVRVFTVGDDRRTFRVRAPLGLAFLPEMKRQAREQPDLPQYHLGIVPGREGVRSDAGGSLAGTFEIPVFLRVNANINLVGMPAFRAR